MLPKLSKEEEKWAYSIISEELIAGKFDNAIWTKAFSESEGDSDKAKAKYIKHRFKEVEAKIVIQKKIDRIKEVEKNSRDKIEADKNIEKKRKASDRARQIQQKLPLIEYEFSEGKSKLIAKKKRLEEKFNEECVLVEEIESSAGLKKIIKAAKLGAVRKKIAKMISSRNKLTIEVDKRQRRKDIYLKELRELEHHLGS